jgi:prepilin-type N-terminal cleavage/methylation domain-containing protein
VTHRRAFTLVELLVTVGIVAILAAILFPVFSAAKKSALSSVCASNFRQVAVSSGLYSGDYDDRYVVPRYTGAERPTPTDRTWVQLVLPYLRTLDVTRCPADHSPRPAGNGASDPDATVGDAAKRVYVASMRANTGYNFVYLAPLVRRGQEWMALPRASSEASDPSNTLVLGDSVWNVTADGRPEGGGSYLIVPPCRFNGQGADTFDLNGFQNDQVYAADQFWEPQAEKPTRSGGLWPWHDGRLTAVMVDGRLRSLRIEEARAGCEVLDDWQGPVGDRDRYLWDLR